jgi:BMFP domain-containing protein YqiC
MIDKKQLDTLVSSLFLTLPESIREMEDKFHQKCKDILQAFFRNLDLVPREEFDVQVKVLARTREKLEALQLEFAKLQEKPS